MRGNREATVTIAAVNLVVDEADDDCARCIQRQRDSRNRQELAEVQPVEADRRIDDLTHVHRPAQSEGSGACHDRLTLLKEWSTYFV